MLEDAMDTDDMYNLECMKLPLSLTIGPKEINQGSGLASYTKSIVQKKKSTTEGHVVLDGEEKLSNHNLHQCQTVEELQEAISHHCDARDKLRSFYYSNSQCKQRRRLELKKRRFYDKLAADERKTSGAKRPIMMIGDRGHGIGSRIKKHQRFGGHWKESRHGLYTPTLITNEYNSSQTCLFCYSKLSHPVGVVAGKIKTVNGSFVCLNQKCPNAFKVVCRDQVSALAIGLAGVAQLLFGVTFPCFDEKSNYTNRIKFNDLALDFLYRKQRMGSPLDGGNTLRGR